MLIVVVTLFAVCWLPLHVFNIILDFVPQLRNEDQPEASSIIVAIYTTTHWLAMSNSFVNPIIYGFLNDSFRVTLTSTPISPLQDSLTCTAVSQKRANCGIVMCIFK